MRITGIIFFFLTLLAGCKSSESPVTDADLLDSSFVMQQDTVKSTSKKALNTLGIKEADFKKAYKLSKQQIKIIDSSFLQL